MPNAPRFCPAVRHTNRCDGPQLNPFWQSITAQKETDVHAAAIPLAADPCVGARERQSPGNWRTHQPKPQRPRSSASNPSYVSVKFSKVRLPRSGLKVNADANSYGLWSFSSGGWAARHPPRTPIYRPPPTREAPVVADGHTPPDAERLTRPFCCSVSRIPVSAQLASPASPRGEPGVCRKATCSNSSR
jgi:hypothetical protein